MKILFIGKDGIYSAAPLRTLIGRHQIVGIARSAPRSFTPYVAALSVWPPRAHRLFDRRDRSTSLSRMASEIDAPVFELRKGGVADLTAFIKRTSPDLICIASMSQLLPAEAIALARYGALNVHPSPLPTYRGPNPWFWQYYNGEREGGLSVLRVDEGSDTGPVLAHRAFFIEPGMTFSQMLEMTSKLASDLILNAVETAIDPAAGRPQKHLPCPFYARRTSLEETFDEWHGWPIERAWHFLRGTHRWLAPNWLLPTLLRAVPWTIGGMEKCGPAERSQVIGLDRSGFYVGHRDGKIRITLDWRGAGLRQLDVKSDCCH